MSTPSLVTGSWFVSTTAVRFRSLLCQLHVTVPLEAKDFVVRWNSVVRSRRASSCLWASTPLASFSAHVIVQPWREINASEVFMPRSTKHCALVPFVLVWIFVWQLFIPVFLFRRSLSACSDSLARTSGTFGRWKMGERRTLSARKVVRFLFSDGPFASCLPFVVALR